MKTTYRLIAAFVCGATAVIVGFTSQSLAQTAAQRIAVVEEYTSATCYPCTTASVVLKPIVKLSNGVIAVRYHFFYPTPGDPFYSANKPENNNRSRLYFGSNPGLPAARVNGHHNVDPQSSNQVTDAIKLDQAQPYPVKIEILHDKTDPNNVKVKVSITSDIALSNYTLQTIVTAHDITLDKLPLLPDDYTETLEHWNGEKEFADALLKILPDTNGTQVELAAGVPKTFDFTYTPKKSDIWKLDELTIVAFLQNNATGEIIQGATSLTGQVGSMVGTTVSFFPSVAPAFLVANPNESVETKLVIGNVSSTAMQYSGLTITTAQRTPADWKMTTDNYSPDFTIEPGKTKEITIKLTRGTSVGSGAVEVSFKEVGGRTLSGVPITMVAKETEGFLVIDNTANKNEPFASAIAARTIKKKYTEISAEHIRGYSHLFPNFKRMIWNGADSGVVDIKDFAFINSKMKTGISVIISGQRNSYEAQFNGVKAELDTFGLTFLGSSKVTSFTVTGYAGDSISNNFSELCSTAGIYPLYKLSLTKPPKAGVTPFLAIADTIIAARYQTPTARMIYLGFNPAIIQNASSRNAMIDKAITWLEDFSFTPLVKLSAAETLDFGVITSSSRMLPLMISNAGNVPFEVSEMTVTGKDSLAFTLNTGVQGMVIPVGGNQEIAVTFNPSNELDNTATLEVKSGVQGAQKLSVALKGRKSSTSVDEGVASSSILSVQPNPARDAISVYYSTSGNEHVVLQLLDVLGHEVQNVVVGEVGDGSHTVHIETSELPSGMYSVVLLIGNKRTQAPVMIVR